MTTIETPSAHTEAVARVLATLTSGTTDGAVERDALRDALASEGRSLLDLPEVGLFLALSEIALTDTDTDTDTDPDAAPDAEPSPPVTVLSMPPIDDDVIDLRDPPSPGSPRVELTAPAAPLEPMSIVEPTSPSTPVPDASVARVEPATPERRAKRWFRRTRRSSPTFAPPDPPAPPAARSELAESRVTPQPSDLPAEHDAAETTSPPVGLAETIAELNRFLGTVLPDAMDQCVVGPMSPGSARPDPYWAPPLLRQIQSLDAHLRHQLATPLSVRFLDPTTAPPSALDPYWPPPLVRQLRGLEVFLRSLSTLPNTVRVPAARQPGATNGTIPDPYWPRHLVRARLVPNPLPPRPRTPEQLEADLQRQLQAVALVGEADLDDSAAEMEIALANLVRTMPLDRVGRVYPATLAAFLVRHTRMWPAAADFDVTIPITALRRTNAVGLAFSEALVRLSKPVFREVEQRDDVDRRSRYVLRMQLHTGISGASIPSVLRAILDSCCAGAASGREVALDWLIAPRSVATSVGEPIFRLLTRTDHGADMLEVLVDLVRWRWLQPETSSPPFDLDPLPGQLIDAAQAWLADQTLPTTSWGAAVRPRVRIGESSTDGPELVLPQSLGRWHLNGELLGYGSPTSHRSVPLPPSRGGRWTVTAETGGRSSPLDIAIQSACRDTVVLAFDERGRHHHHALPLGGKTATIIAGRDTLVDGERERTALAGRWNGFERIVVELRNLDEITVSPRGHTPISYRVDHRLHTEFSSPHLVFRGHVPEPAEVEIIVTDGVGETSALLSDRGITGSYGAFNLGGLLSPGPQRTVSLSVARHGFEARVFEVALAADEPEFTGATPHKASSTLIAVRALSAGDRVENKEADALWSADPVLAAATDDWRCGPDAMRRWVTATGWTPPGPAIAPLTALARLVQPLLDAISTDRRREPEQPGAEPGRRGLLTPAQWAAALEDGVEPLEEWVRRCRRPLWRWRTTRPALRQFDPLWASARPHTKSRLVLPVLAAGLVSFTNGPNQAIAATWLDDAFQAAPALATSAAVMAAAYTRIQRVHPESRFQAIPLTTR